MTSEFGDTPLHYAVDTRDAEFVTALCQAGASVNIRSRRGTPLQVAEKLKDAQLMKVLAQYDKSSTHSH